MVRFWPWGDIAGALGPAGCGLFGRRGADDVGCRGWVADWAVCFRGKFGAAVAATFLVLGGVGSRKGAVTCAT